MSRVEIRLTNEGNEPTANFEIYTEIFKNGQYVESAPIRAMASGGAPIIQFPEEDERIVIVSKGNSTRMVFDKEQNANVRVETETEAKERQRRDELVAQSHADQGVRAAEAGVALAQEASVQAEHAAGKTLRQAEADAAKVKAEQTKSPPTSTSTTSKPTPSPSSAQKPISPGAPASANTGPVDSKQVKAEGGTPTPVKSNG
jgi:hypothetical protein